MNVKETKIIKKNDWIKCGKNSYFPLITSQNKKFKVMEYSRGYLYIALENEDIIWLNDYCAMRHFKKCSHLDKVIPTTVSEVFEREILQAEDDCEPSGHIQWLKELRDEINNL